ncbi:MAG: efflux RND transporter periplasmic adaptor subunit [Candidatus Latescibacteria bacterium]|nr:efflux RND transporter periplasmic adaptor subunit [Candidatus Latescibacterota bacterium]
MRTRTKVIIGASTVVVIGVLAVASIKYQRKKTVTVQTQRVERLDLTARVSASGKIETTRKVEVSASISGKVVQLAVQEGQFVTKGQLLLQIDPTPTQATVAQLQASIRSAKANLALVEANLTQAKVESERQQALMERGVTSVEVAQRTKASYEVEVARRNAAREDIARLEATLKNAQHDLTKVNILADMDGLVTKLNIHEGENAFVGTFNNPGTVLMTISDLSHMEAWVEVDETDVVDVRVGYRAEVMVDAYPDTVFHGVVDRIGNSPLAPQAGSGDRQSINFQVVIRLTDAIPNVRPGLSCVADVITGRRTKALAIPIQALTVRTPPKKGADSLAVAAAEESSNSLKRRSREHEGVFIIKNGKATFRHVLTGLTGERRFEVLSGLREGEEVIVSPFEALRTLKDGDLVKVETKKKEEKKSS